MTFVTRTPPPKCSMVQAYSLVGALLNCMSTHAIKSSFLKQRAMPVPSAMLHVISEVEYSQEAVHMTLLHQT